MNSEMPVRRIAWVSLAVQLPIMAALIGMMYWVVGLSSWASAATAGAAIYLIWSRFSKIAALQHHRKLDLIRSGLFDQAVSSFSKSYDRLSRHSWLDRYRFIFLLDSSAVTYREMALVNKAYAQFHSGSVVDALETYKAILQQFPQSTIARDGQFECKRLLETNDAN